MLTRLVLLFTLMLAIGAQAANAQVGVGKKFGSRDPHTCPSRKAGLSADQAKQYFMCDTEFVQGPVITGEGITLVTDVKIQVAKPRPFNMQMDTIGFATTNGIDPSQPVYPIQGSFTQWSCAKLGAINGDPGKNCTKWVQPNSKGICFKSSFGDWHCTMADFGSSMDFPTRYPPPAGQ